MFYKITERYIFFLCLIISQTNEAIETPPESPGPPDAILLFTHSVVILAINKTLLTFKFVVTSVVSQLAMHIKRAGRCGC